MKARIYAQGALLGEAELVDPARFHRRVAPAEQIEIVIVDDHTRPDAKPLYGRVKLETLG